MIAGAPPRFAVQLLDEGDLAAVAEEHRAAIVQGAGAGRAIDGSSLGTHKGGRRKGQTITLEQSGELLDSLTVSREPGAATLSATAPHAPHVFARFPTVLQLDPDASAESLAERFDAKQDPS